MAGRAGIKRTFALHVDARAWFGSAADSGGRTLRMMHDRAYRWALARGPEFLLDRARTAIRDESKYAEETGYVSADVLAEFQRIVEIGKARPSWQRAGYRPSVRSLMTTALEQYWEATRAQMPTSI